MDFRAGKRVLVAGGSGFLGSQVASELATRDVAEVVALRSATCDPRERDATRAARPAELVGFRGEIAWDRSKPDGQPRRWLDTTRAEREFGFGAHTTQRDGLERTIEWHRATRPGGAPSRESTAAPDHP